MMPIQPEENSRALHRTLPRQMHAPMYVLISGVIRAARNKRPRRKSPVLQKNRTRHKRNHPHRDQRRPIPPGHRNRIFILLINEMIRLIRLENVMMNQRMPLEGISKKLHRLVHDIPVKRPFKKRCKNRGDQKTHRRPEKEGRYHGIMGWLVVILSKSVGNPSFGQVVRRHFQAHTIADRQAHKMPAHFAGDVREYFMLVIQHHTKHRAWQNRLDRSFQLNGLFTTHILLLQIWTGPDRRASENSTEDSPAWD